MLASSVRVLVLLALALCANFALAQCEPKWMPGHGIPGVAKETGQPLRGSVRAFVDWDPDGPGPQPPVIVVAGDFELAGEARTNRVAVLDPVSGIWTNLGRGMNAPVNALAVLATGELVAGGEFTLAEGLPVGYLARWNGTNWVPLGGGLNSSVNALAVLPNGDLVAGGKFSHAGGSLAVRVARWDGATWWPLTSGVGGEVRTLLVEPSGTLLVGGSFVVAGGLLVQSVARWDGANWSAIPTGAPGTVHSIARTASGDLVLGGLFTVQGVATPVVRQSGGQWISMAPNTLGEVRSVLTLPNGDVLVAGDFQAMGTVAASRIARWSGAAWSALGTGISGFLYPSTTAVVMAMVRLRDGRVLVGGDFLTAGEHGAIRAAIWDGTQWAPPSNGFNRPVRAIVAWTNGDYVVGGDFTWTPSGPIRTVARWDGTAWRPLGQGLRGVVNALVRMPNGDLVAGGSFSDFGGCSVARWDGFAWRSMNTAAAPGNFTSTASLLVRANGNLIAGLDSDGVCEWNGTAWQLIGPGLWGDAKRLAFLADGSLVVGGSTYQRGWPSAGAKAVMRWNGTSWSALVPWVVQTTCTSMIVTSQGDLVVGNHTAIPGQYDAQIAKWNGAVWSVIGPPGYRYAAELQELPDGDLLSLSGSLLALSPFSLGVQRWNGSAWSFFTSIVASDVKSSLWLPDQQLLMGGDILAAGGIPSYGFARLEATCPAAATSFGAGCPGATGTARLNALDLPWIDSGFRLRATGLASNSLALVLCGVVPTSVPLLSLHPLGVPGCDLYTLGDVGTSLRVAVAGSLVHSIEIPDDPFLVGLTARVQVAVKEFDAAGAVTGVVSTNAIDFTLGRF